MTPPPINNQRADLARALAGPVVLITLGVLFSFDRYTELRFTETWPVLLIVFGLLRLAGGPRRRKRHFPPQSAPGEFPPNSGGPHP